MSVRSTTGLVGLAAELATARGLLARGVLRLGDDDLAAAAVDLATPAGRQQPLRRRLPALGYLSEVEFRLGAWDDALEHSTLAAVLADDAGPAGTQAFLHGVATLVPACRGDAVAAAGHLARARAAAVRSGAPADLAWLARAGAHAAWAAGDPEGVLTAVRPALEAAADEPGVAPWRELRAEALAALGRDVEADAAVRELEQAGAAGGRRSTLAGARVLRGRLAARRGDDAAAVAAYRQGAGLFAELAMPFGRARADAALGAHLRRRGRRREALALLGAARETFTALRARPFAARVDREVVACGGSRRRGCTGLTPQETAVAGLVAAGLTNKQIAAELVVSVKTVEYHLGHVFAKLGMRSRAQLAAYLARGGS